MFLPLSRRCRAGSTFAHSLSCMAPDAKTLAVGYVIPAAAVLAAMRAKHDRANVIRLGLAFIAAHPAAILACPRVTV